MKRLNIVLAGYGGVGRAIVPLLHARRRRLADRFDVDVRLTGILRARGALVDSGGLGAAGLPDDVFTARFAAPGDFLAAARAQLLIEAGPTDLRTGEPALAHIRAALGMGCPVIAVSKGALVVDGPALRERAEAGGLAFGVSAAAAVGLPTIAMARAARGQSRLRLEGILNGTSNMLLDMMMDEGLTLDEALARARAAGVAEADPALDIDGWDIAAKMAIIALFGLDTPLHPDAMSVESMRFITPEQIADWRAAGLRPRLIGRLWRDDGPLRGAVTLRTYAADDRFAHVRARGKALRVEIDGVETAFAASDESSPAETAAAALDDLEQMLAARR